MKPAVSLALFVLIAIAVAGCTDASPAGHATTSSSTAPPPTPAGKAGGWVTAGFVGPPVTREASIGFQANATGRLNARLTVNGTVAFEGPLEDANRTWTLPLAYGQSAVRLDASASNRTYALSFVAVRLGATNLEIDYCVFHPSNHGGKADQYDVWIDPDSRPSLPDYEAQKARHAAFFTAHDQLRQWSNETGIRIETTFFKGSPEGFTLDKVDGVGSPVSSSAPPYWILYKNGKSADLGMSLIPIHPGDQVSWRLC